MSKELFPEYGPVMFGQVREDAGVEVELLRSLRKARSAFAIASGGCTLFSLLGEAGVRVDALDISRAQVALVERKARLFMDKSFDDARKECIELNNCGTVDQKLQMLTKLFFLGVHSRKETEIFLSMNDTAEQQRFYTDSWDNWQWRTATSVAFSKQFLAMSRFGNAMQLVPDNFADAMRSRFHRAFTAFPNRTNPYLWQTFFNKYNEAGDDALPLYLQSARANTMIKNMRTAMSLLCGDLYSFFDDAENKEQYDFVALSNVLELLPAEYAARLAWKLVERTSKEGLIVVRSIFPRNTRHFPDHIEGLTYDPQLSAQAEARDRSLFCNFIEVYRRA